MPGRLYAIGDIHGCSTALGALIEAIDPRPDDTIVTLGDYVDWGPDSRSVIRQLIELSGRCRLVPLLGNHEEMLLQALESDSALRAWLDLGGEQTLLSYPYDGTIIIDPDHVRFIRGCRDYFETEEFIFVHASYDPSKPMREQSNTTLRWEHIEPERMRPHFSGKTVIAGHTPQTVGEPLDLGFLKVIDTDCSRGGWLTALEARIARFIQANQRGEVRHGKLDSVAKAESSVEELEQSRGGGSNWTTGTGIEPKRPTETTEQETESSQQSSQEIVTDCSET